MARWESAPAETARRIAEHDVKVGRFYTVGEALESAVREVEADRPSAARTAALSAYSEALRLERAS